MPVQKNCDTASVLADRVYSGEFRDEEANAIFDKLKGLRSNKKELLYSPLILVIDLSPRDNQKVKDSVKRFLNCLSEDRLYYICEQMQSVVDSSARLEASLSLFVYEVSQVNERIADAIFGALLESKDFKLSNFLDFLSKRNYDLFNIFKIKTENEDMNKARRSNLAEFAPRWMGISQYKEVIAKNTCHILNGDGESMALFFRSLSEGDRDMIINTFEKDRINAFAKAAFPKLNADEIKSFLTKFEQRPDGVKLVEKLIHYVPEEMKNQLERKREIQNLLESVFGY